MPLDRGLVETWREWERAPKPIENFEAGRRSAPSYSIEGSLDDVGSSVFGLAYDLMRGRIPDNFRARITEEQEELKSILLELEGCPLPPETKARLTAYIALTSRLLDKMKAPPR